MILKKKKNLPVASPKLEIVLCQKDIGTISENCHYSYYYSCKKVQPPVFLWDRTRTVDLGQLINTAPLLPLGYQPMKRQKRSTEGSRLGVQPS